MKSKIGGEPAILLQHVTKPRNVGITLIRNRNRIESNQVASG